MRCGWGGDGDGVVGGERGEGYGVGMMKAVAILQPEGGGGHISTPQSPGIVFRAGFVRRVGWGGKLGALYSTKAQWFFIDVGFFRRLVVERF